VHGRGCGSLLALWLLILCSTLATRGQTPAAPETAGLHLPVVDVLVLDQPVSAHPQSPAWARSTLFRPKPPGQFGGLGSGKGSPPGGGPTFTQLARTAGTVFGGTVTRIAPGAAAGGSAVPTVAITFYVEHPLRGAVAGGSLTILEWPVLWSSGQRYAELGNPCFSSCIPRASLDLAGAVGGALGQFQLDSAGGILPSRQQVADFQPDPLFAGRSRIAFNDFSRALRQSVAEQAPERS